MAMRQTFRCLPPLATGIQRPGVRLASFLGVPVLFVILLAACSPISTRTTPVNGPASTGTPVNGPTSTGTPVNSPTSTGTTRTSDMVTLLLNHQQYSRGATVVVTIHNGLHSSIYAAAAATDCTIVQLERQAGGSWQVQGSCVNNFPHPRIELIAPGATLSVELLPGSSAGADSGTGSESEWPAGTYRAEFRYVTSQGLPLTQGTTVYSASFVVA